MTQETERKEIDPDEMDQSVPKNEAPPLEFFPEREWLHAKVDHVDYRYVYRNGQQQYVQNKDKEDIIDRDTNERIPRKEFNITMLLHDYYLPNGDARKAWCSLGASMSERAHLPQVLEKFSFGAADPTPNQIKSVFQGVEVRFMVVNKKTQATQKPYQAVDWDSLRPVTSPAPAVKTDDQGNPIAWDE